MIFSLLLLDLSHFTPDAIPTKRKLNNRARIFCFLSLILKTGGWHLNKPSE